MKNISKILLAFISLFLMVGCGNMMNTPTKKVEEFLSKYQTLDKDVLDQLDDVIDDNESFTDEQRDKYHELMKNQYKSLSYKIKDETEDGDNATIIAEIEVLDYGKAISMADAYLATHREEFLLDKNTPTDNNNDDTTKDNNTAATDTVIDKVKYLTYKIKQMASTKDKVTYTINFNLTKDDGKWKLNDLSDIDILKLHGLYY